MANELRSLVVLDATVLSNLAVTDDLDVLPARFVTVEAVTDELRAGVEAGYDHLGRAIDSIEVIAVEGEPERDVLDELDSGESYALFAAQKRTGMLATDAARRANSQRNVESNSLAPSVFSFGSFSATNSQSAKQTRFSNGGSWTLATTLPSKASAKSSNKGSKRYSTTVYP